MNRPRKKTQSDAGRYTTVLKREQTALIRPKLSLQAAQLRVFGIDVMGIEREGR